MRIINTVKKAKGKRQKAKVGFKNLYFYFCIALLPFGFLLLAFVTGCIQKENLEQAQGYIKQSQEYYQRAVSLYQSLIAQGEDLDRLHFELGKLYYDQGEFKLAIEEFTKTPSPQAKKFLAISFYKIGNFVDALEVFSKANNIDDECLYYYGLTAEKLNLYDQALDIFKKIKAAQFLPLALERIGTIEKQASLVHIKDISPQVAEILAAAPSGEVYPQAGALILYCDEKIEVTSSNTQVSSLHYIIKILNERGKENFSETHIDYDSTYEKVELEYARTIKPDGTVQEVGSRHIRDVSKYLNFPLYSNARVYIISFPEITEGSSIEYKLKIRRNQLINKKDLVMAYPVQASEPIIVANFTLDLPVEKILNIKILNAQYNNFGAKLQPAEKKEGGRTIYSWQFESIPQIIPEPNMPANAEINPTIFISTFGSWQEIYNWWWQLAKDKIRADAAIKEKVSELTVNQISDEAKIRAVYNFCAMNIRYVAVEYGQAGHEPHFAYDIFKNKYGDCKDQAILLVTMLKEIGFSAWPVLIPTKEEYNLNEDFPSVIFNHCIAAVSLKDKVIFLDPTAQTCSFGDLPTDDQARKVLIFREDGYRIQDTPFYGAEHNLIKQELKMKINSDESVVAKKTVSTTGIYDQAQRFWLLYTAPVLIEETLKVKIQEISIGGKLDKYNIANLGDLNEPVVLNYAFIGPQYFTAAGKFRIMPQLSGLDTSLVAQDKRQYPIDFNILDTRESISEIELPDNFLIKYMPPSISEDTPWFELVIEYSRKENKIFFRQKMTLKKNTVTQQDYPNFKVVFETLAQKIQQRIVIEKK